MKKYRSLLIGFGVLIAGAILFTLLIHAVTPANHEDQKAQNELTKLFPTAMAQQSQGALITLPRPVTDGRMSLERALSLRRSIRSYTDEPMTLAEVSQLLWSGQGITNPRGFRTAPSAGATFPLDLFVVVNNVTGLRDGIYQYLPADHRLRFVDNRQVQVELARASLGQTMVSEGAIVIVFAAIFERTTRRYGERGERYIHNEVGHASQNIHLQAAALNLGTVVIGAFRDEEVERILNLGEQYRVLYMMPVGKI